MLLLGLLLGIILVASVCSNRSINDDATTVFGQPTVDAVDATSTTTGALIPATSEEPVVTTQASTPTTAEKPVVATSEEPFVATTEMMTAISALRGLLETAFAADNGLISEDPPYDLIWSDQTEIEIVVPEVTEENYLDVAEMIVSGTTYSFTGEAANMPEHAVVFARFGETNMASDEASGYTTRLVKGLSQTYPPSMYRALPDIPGIRPLEVGDAVVKFVLHTNDAELTALGNGVVTGFAIISSDGVVQFSYTLFNFANETMRSYFESLIE